MPCAPNPHPVVRGSQEAALPEAVLTVARVEGLDASMVALMAVTRDAGAWKAVISISVAEVRLRCPFRLGCNILALKSRNHSPK